MNILVTVGMGPWPLDRLLRVVPQLCAKHRVVAQTGPSQLTLPCEQHAWLPFPVMMKLIEDADVVVTHAGNTVRIVQRFGKVPIAMARQAVHGEMSNDHQVHYLRHEEQEGRVIALWNELDLLNLIDNHAENEKRLRSRFLPPAQSADNLVTILDTLCAKWIP